MNLSYRVKRTPQAEHWKGFSPVCVLMWRGSFPAPWIIFWQTGHCWGVWDFLFLPPPATDVAAPRSATELGKELDLIMSSPKPSMSSSSDSLSFWVGGWWAMRGRSCTQWRSPPFSVAPLPGSRMALGSPFCPSLGWSSSGSGLGGWVGGRERKLSDAGEGWEAGEAGSGFKGEKLWGKPTFFTFFLSVFLLDIFSTTFAISTVLSLVVWGGRCSPAVSPSASPVSPRMSLQASATHWMPRSWAPRSTSLIPELGMVSVAV